MKLELLSNVMAKQTGQGARSRSPLPTAALLFLGFVGLCCGCHSKTPVGNSQPAGKVELPVVRAEVMEVKPTPWPTTIRTQGILVADEVTVVGAKIAGRVEELHADLGDLIA